MLKNPCSRRSFLKASVAGIALLTGSTTAFSKVPKYDNLSDGTLHLFNTHTGERLALNYLSASGEYDPDALIAINRILRCHHTGEVKEIDLRVVDFLNRVDKELGGGNEIHIISGYRSPSYNTLLRSRGRKVARRSLHLDGMAIDIAMPHVPLERVRRTALNLRLGGVGYYPGRGFVHIDSGALRTW